MIANYCSCAACGGFGGRCSFMRRNSATNSTGFLTITADATATNAPNQTGFITSSRYRQSALELDRQLEEFARRAKIKVVRPVVKVDEKRLIAKPGRELAKPHRSQSSRAAMLVRQFASRMK